MKIAVYAIAKNEELFIERFIESVRDADLILIGDTGSSDRTPELARALGVEVININVFPWRFDTARNEVLNALPYDIDVCIPLDIDEVMMAGWREEIERVWSVGNTTRLRYKFDYGNGLQYFSEKIHARVGFTWNYPCHEYICPAKDMLESFAHTNMILTTHKPDPMKSRAQYLDLLADAAAESPDCERMALYYGRELFFHGRHQDAINQLQVYLNSPNVMATYNIGEKAYAMRMIGDSYQALANYADATCWYRSGTLCSPDTRDPWVALASGLYVRGVTGGDITVWAECLSAALIAINITTPEMAYHNDPACWGMRPHDLAALAAYNVGAYGIAVEQGTIALSLEPDNDRLAKNLAFYEAANTGPK